MENRNSLTKILAAGGFVLVCLPILAPVFFAVLHFVRARRFLLDYLMPAELFLFVLIGGGLLLWAAVRARAQRGLIGGALGIATVLLISGQALAILTGLASGEAEPTGWRWGLVMGSIVVYTLAVIATAVGGVLLLRDLFGVRRLPAV